jgi:hypothetical protein
VLAGIRLASKLSKTLAYFVPQSVMKEKSVTILIFGDIPIKLFTAVIHGFL